MASLNTNVLHHAPSILRSIGTGVVNMGSRFMGMLVKIAEFSSTYQAIEYYNSLSDEQLAEMGMTRQDVVEKIFGSRSYL